MKVLHERVGEVLLSPTSRYQASSWVDVTWVPPRVLNHLHSEPSIRVIITIGDKLNGQERAAGGESTFLREGSLVTAQASRWC